MVFLGGFNVVHLTATTSIISFQDFLAAMSSSRSDVVTQFVRSCVRPFVPFFSFSVLGVSMVFQGCIKVV